jgi:hypothetical protein
MNGSIGKLAEEVVQEVKNLKLEKLAEFKKTAADASHPKLETEIGAALQKLAADLRSKSNVVTVSDVVNFVNEVGANAK